MFLLKIIFINNTAHIARKWFSKIRILNVSLLQTFFLQGNKNNKSILLFQILIMNCCQNSHKLINRWEFFVVVTFSEYQVEETSGKHMQTCRRFLSSLFNTAHFIRNNVRPEHHLDKNHLLIKRYVRLRFKNARCIIFKSFR